MIRRLFLTGIWLFLPCALAAPLPLPQVADRDLSAASLEELTKIQISVNSFARKEEDLWKTPAAVFVISQEDIARSAASSIPELLRMVPGMQVAQVDASTWAVSARGFNSVYANKLLVLIDGRTVYSEIYSGEHWDQIDLPLDDIERIEIIRGPGAAVWGTNAVNGVINIITKRARSTVGPEASGSIGRINQTTTLRYGGSLGDRAQYRGYASYVNREPLETITGRNAFDGENTLRGGGRIDWQRTQADWITLSGDLHGGHLKQQTLSEVPIPVEPDGREYGSIAGGYMLSRWERKLRGGDTALQVYFDDTSRHELATYARTRTIDVDFEDHLAAGKHSDLVWGQEFRFTADHAAAQVLPTIKPEYRNYLIDGFAQDELSLIPNRLIATLGSKIQQGTLAGFQVQPSARLLWSLSTQSLWAAVSRAVVAPSLQDEDLNLPLTLGTEQGLPIVGTLLGNPAYKPETVLAYEAGYRKRLGSRFTVDVATFINKNGRIQTLSIQPPIIVASPEPYVSTSLLYTNDYRASTAGIEAALSWKPLSSLSFQAGYSWSQAHTAQTISAPVKLVDSWNTPRNTFTASSAWSFAHDWNLNGSVYHVDKVQMDSFISLAPTSSKTFVPAFTRLDMHIARKVGRYTELDAGGTNLLTPRHLEFGTGTAFINSAYVPRSLFVRSKWSF